MREVRREKIEVHVGVICFRLSSVGELEVLVGKRAETKELYPGFWDTGGGALNEGEDFREAAERKLSEEFGVQAKILEPVSDFRIAVTNDSQLVIPGVKFICLFERYTHGDEPAIQVEDFSEAVWQPVDRLDELELIPGEPTDAQQDILTAASLFMRPDEGDDDQD